MICSSLSRSTSAAPLMVTVLFFFPDHVLREHLAARVTAEPCDSRTPGTQPLARVEQPVVLMLRGLRRPCACVSFSRLPEVAGLSDSKHISQLWSSLGAQHYL